MNRAPFVSALLLILALTSLQGCERNASLAQRVHDLAEPKVGEVVYGTTPASGPDSLTGRMLQAAQSVGGLESGGPNLVSADSETKTLRFSDGSRLRIESEADSHGEMVLKQVIVLEQ